MLDGLVNFLIDFLNLLIEALGALVGVLVGLLPDSPFLTIENFLNQSAVAEFLPGLNWVLPIASFISIGVVWLGGIALYYLISVALRFVKLIE